MRLESMASGAVGVNAYLRLKHIYQWTGMETRLLEVD
jgi:hypothetical protein